MSEWQIKTCLMSMGLVQAAGPCQTFTPSNSLNFNVRTRRNVKLSGTFEISNFPNGVPSEVVRARRFESVNMMSAICALSKCTLENGHAPPGHAGLRGSSSVLVICAPISRLRVFQFWYSLLRLLKGLKFGRFGRCLSSTVGAPWHAQASGRQTSNVSN